MNISLHSNLFKNISHVIFDKDGTITDSHTYWGEIIRRRAILLQKLCPTFSISCCDIEKAMGYDKSIGKLIPNGPIAIKNRDEVIHLLIIFFLGNNISLTKGQIESVFDEVHSTFVNESNQYILPIDGVVEFIRMLKRNSVKLSLITSDTFEGARASLDKLDILYCFDFLAGKDSGFGHKITGLPALEACNFVGERPQNTIILGDAPMDYIMGLSSGISAVLICTGQIEKKQLLETCPFVCDNITDLHIEF